MNANLRNFALWVIIVLLLLALFTLFQNPGQRSSSQDISFSQLLTEVDQGHVREVVMQGPEIHGTFADGRQWFDLNSLSAAATPIPDVVAYCDGLLRDADTQLMWIVPKGVTRERLYTGQGFHPTTADTAAEMASAH